MSKIDLPNGLLSDIKKYCSINNIDNIDDYIISLINTGFYIEKYGNTPNSTVKEKIIEKIIEVPVYKNDSELTETVKKLTDENVILNNKIKELNDFINNIKNKKDIYGE